jgi:hypothetical protein
MAGETHSIYGVKIGTTLLGGISDTSIDSGLADGGKAANGQIYRYFASVRSGKPKVSFTTLHIADGITAAPLTGVSLASNNLIMYGHQKAIAGGRAATYVSFTMANGCLYPTRLSCRTNDDATLAVDGLLLSDPTGANDFVVHGAASPTGTLLDNLRYTLGTISVAGTTITNVTNVDIDFGITANAVDADSYIIPRFAAIDAIAPKITIDVLDLSLFAAGKFTWASGSSGTWPTGGGYGYHGKTAINSNTSIQFRKRLIGGGFVSTGSITLSTQGLAYVSSIAKGTDQGDQSGQIVIESIHDGTNAPLAMAIA